MALTVKLKTLIYLSVLGIAGCSSSVNKEGFLGSAIVEGQTYQITAVTQGNIVAIYKNEGEPVSLNELLAVVDTVPLVLRKQEMESGIAELEASISAKRIEIEAMQTDVAGLRREFERIDTLASKGAVTIQQRDNLRTQYQSAQLRYEASRKQLVSLIEKAKGLQARLDQLNDQISRDYLRSPSGGIVLTRYRNLEEVVGPGNPVFEIGKFDTLYADFFVPQPVLATLRYEQRLRIRVDYSTEKDGEAFIPGYISWISPEAEFSPKNIQTRESRNELVFRVRVTIPNSDGILKRGLPVEVWR